MSLRRASAQHGRLVRSAGFSYVEVLVAAVVLALCLPPALDALRAATSSAAVQSSTIALRYRVGARLETVLAEQYAALDAAAVAAGSAAVPTTYSDPGGTVDRRLVFAARYDLDNLDGDANPRTGGDPGLLWVRVALENRPLIALETLVAP
jgi:hypothetical protein